MVILVIPCMRQGFLLLHMQTAHVHGVTPVTPVKKSPPKTTAGPGAPTSAAAETVSSVLPNKTVEDSKVAPSVVAALDNMEAGSSPKARARWSLRRVASEIRGKQLGAAGTGRDRGDGRDSGKEGGSGGGSGGGGSPPSARSLAAASHASFRKTLKFIPDVFGGLSPPRQSRRSPQQSSSQVKLVQRVAGIKCSASLLRQSGRGVVYTWKHFLVKKNETVV